MTLGGAADFFL